jgi:prepilin-type N-terminal cleavage/methylation domain-containing protein
MEMKTKKGFTLIEILIITAIVGILAVGGYPVLKSLKKDRYLRSEAELLVSNINYLKYFAVSEGADYIIRFRSDGKYYALEKLSDGSILREHTFEGAVVFDFATSSNMIDGSFSSRYLLVQAKKGIVSGLLPLNDIRISLISSNSSPIFVEIVPGRKESISWNQ